MTGAERKTALITGGTRRLGRAVAAHLGSRGWSLVLTYRSDHQAAEQAREELGCTTSVRTVKCDVGRAGEVESLLAEVGNTEGRLDFLLHNVGHYAPQAAADVTPEAWDTTIRTNLDGGFYCAYYSRPLLAASRGLLGYMGYSGLHGTRADPEAIDYQVSKLGLLSLVRSLGVAYGPLGIRVAMVSPGQMDNSIDLPERTDVIPLGRWGTPADLCAAWDYLLAADYVTGVNIDVAGGFRL